MQKPVKCQKISLLKADRSTERSGRKPRGGAGDTRAWRKLPQPVLTVQEREEGRKIKYPLLVYIALPNDDEGEEATRFDVQIIVFFEMTWWLLRQNMF